MNSLSITIKLNRAAPDTTLAALRQAVLAAVDLDSRGCTITDVEVRMSTAVVTVAEPPPGIAGSIHVRRVIGNQRSTLNVARHMGVQLQWTTWDQPKLLRRADANG